MNESNTHLNEKDLGVVQVWDYKVKDDLKELTGTTYTNKMHLIFGSSSLKNSTIKYVMLGEIMGWWPSRKFSTKRVNKDKLY